MDKYDPKGTFQDPIVRCFKCQKILKVESLKKLGKCRFCGGTKMSNVTIMDEKELGQVKAWNLDQEYIKEWGVVDEG